MTSISHKLFNKIDGRTIDLLIHLGSGQVSLALVYRNNEELPVILQARTKKVPFGYNPTPKELQRSVLQACDTLLASFVTELGTMYEINDLYDSHQTIHAAYVTLSPLWTTTDLVTHTQSFNQPTEITADMVQEYISTYTTDNTIDASIVSAEANKYQINPKDIIGMETPELELQIKISELNSSTKESIEEILESHISLERIEEIDYIPSPVVMVSAVTQLFGTNDDYMIVHIDAEDSHVVTKTKAEGMKFDSVSYGLAEIKRQLILAGYVPDFVHARDLLRAYFDRALEDGLTAKIDYTLSIESQVLANLVGDMTVKSVPLFVLADDNSEHFFDRYVVKDLENISNAVEIEAEHFEGLYEAVGEYVQPVREILALLLHTGLKK